MARVSARRHTRRGYADRLKVGLIAAIIASHGLLGYSGFDDAWPYQQVRERGLAESTDIVLGTLALGGGLFAMGLFFLVAGLLSPGSLARRGGAGYVRERLVRLGVPLAAWVLVVWPLVVYVAHRAGGDAESPWFFDGTPFLDTGPMWFIEVLLIYSIAYAVWRTRRPAANVRTPVDGRLLAILAVAVSVATFALRLVFPFGSFQVAHLNLWQWPQYLALFCLGVIAGERGGLDPVPARLSRGCGLAALAGLLAFLAVGAGAAAADLDPETFLDERWHWAPLALALIEGPLAVGASVWALGFAQRRLDGPPGPLTAALARSAYAAFVLQGPVLVGLALALREVDAAAEIKALLVAGAGVSLSFACAWLLVTRTPAGRIL